MSAIAFALAASLLWGFGDFLGGITSRRISALAVLAISQTVGLVAILVVALAAADASLTAVGALAAVGAGAGGAVGLAALYRGMAVGAIGVVAPISASAAAIPVAVGLIRGERPSPLQLAGVALALVGVALVSREPAVTGARFAAGVPLALIAAGGFGSYFVFMDRASADDALWAVVAARAFASALSVGTAAARRSLVVPLAHLPVLVVVGMFDVAANVFLAFALTRGYVSIVSVLASLYPVITVVLAIAVLRERPAPSQAFGGAGALAGVGLISAG